ncbi:MAG TPA: DUF2950 domain-containing protein [Bryobacteraceae bacterium]|jgi:Protein of unknown function (DUF2950)|nr:DUF2950 domain-containing protein [Bryobacteraceae bacterium]
MSAILKLHCACGALALLLSSGPLAAAVPQTLFSTTDDAVQALVSAAEAKDQAAMTAVLGPDREKLLSGDPVEDANALAHFAERLRKSVKLVRVDDAKFTLTVGDDQFPFPIPLIKAGDKWRFDTAAGLDEILSRRIGQNELSAMMTCRAYVVAQWEYFTQALDTSEDGLAVYAQKFVSTPGQRDGLYWDVAEGEKPSPMGKLIVEARAEGYPAGRSQTPAATGSPDPQRQRTPFHGYFLRVLKAQGPHAPGGKFSYVINGHMIAGYALVAYPAKWGSGGIMTFIVNSQGRVYQKNLGAKTAEIANAMTEYDPDPSWTLVKEP